MRWPGERTQNFLRFYWVWSNVVARKTGSECQKYSWAHRYCIYGREERAGVLDGAENWVSCPPKSWVVLGVVLAVCGGGPQWWGGGVVGWWGGGVVGWWSGWVVPAERRGSGRHSVAELNKSSGDEASKLLVTLTRLLVCPIPLVTLIMGNSGNSKRRTGKRHLGNSLSALLVLFLCAKRTINFKGELVKYTARPTGHSQPTPRDACSSKQAP